MDHGFHLSEELTCKVRVIGKTNVVLHVYEVDKHVVNICIRKKGPDWFFRAKMIASDFKWTRAKKGKLSRNDPIIGKVQEYMKHYLAEKVLLE